MSLTGGHAVEPEQSTLAIITHHPQAIYFGMKSGRLVPPEKSRDAIIHDPRRRRGSRVQDGEVQFDDAFEESREEAVEENQPGTEPGTAPDDEEGPEAEAA